MLLRFDAFSLRCFLAPQYFQKAVIAAPLRRSRAANAVLSAPGQPPVSQTAHALQNATRNATDSVPPTAVFRSHGALPTPNRNRQQVPAPYRAAPRHPTPHPGMAGSRRQHHAKARQAASANTTPGHAASSRHRHHTRAPQAARIGNHARPTPPSRSRSAQSPGGSKRTPSRFKPSSGLERSSKARQWGPVDCWLVCVPCSF